MRSIQLLIPAAVLLTPTLFGQPPSSAKDRPSCDLIRERLNTDGPSMAMIDPDPDLLKGEGITTDASILATGGRSVRGVTPNAVVVLRFRANFAGERLQLTIFNDAGEPSKSSAEDGGLANVPIDASGSETPFQSLHFDSGSLMVTAVKNGQEATAFALFRAPEDFARDQRDDDKASRGLSFRVQSLDLPCFTFSWPSATGSKAGGVSLAKVIQNR
jgi:hypothetical protein